ncbi:MAG: enoyl-CoA hydratase/isomerase family protein [Proteobacteria bacterium]|nr:enoyl-CoA hydratase/isomerase family protein [Pseudomonadota bacterium]MBI3497301.1 enoyl-CoA hydratase/isomerase family protein [Pseudomonadota bacterium]
MSDVVLVAKDGPIATVTLNRPEKLNALNKPMWEELGRIMGALSEEDGLRCVVITGAGEKAFGPGADIAEFEAERANAAQARAYGKLMHRTMASVADCRHPTVAMIKGICVGGGLEIALMCDLRICGESSRFGVPINRLGLVMAYPEIEALIQLVGRSTALEILFEARVFGAAEALQKRLVNRVVADDKVEEEGYATARRIAEGAPLVNRWHKKFAKRLARPESLSEAEFAEGYACFDTEDYQTGFRSFLAKTKPAFKGR